MIPRYAPIPAIVSADELLRVLARGEEVGHAGRLHTLGRGDLMTIARNYCDANGLSYARSDLQIAERVPFLAVRDGDVVRAA